MKLATSAATLCLMAALAQALPFDFYNSFDIADDILAEMGITRDLKPAELQARVTAMVVDIKTTLDDFMDNIDNFDFTKISAKLQEARRYLKSLVNELDSKTQAEIYTGARQAFKDVPNWITELPGDLGFDLSDKVKANLSARLGAELDRALDDFQEETKDYSEDELRETVREEVEEFVATTDAVNTFYTSLSQPAMAIVLKDLQTGLGEFLNEDSKDYTYSQYKEAMEGALSTLMFAFYYIR